MEKLKNKFKSVRMKLFLSLCIVVTLIILFLIIINNVVLESFYLFSKTNDLKLSYEKINKYYSEINYDIKLNEELNKMSKRNNFDILIKKDDNMLVYSSESDLNDSVEKINQFIVANNDDKIFHINNKSIVVYKNENITIRKISDVNNSINYMYLTGVLDNGYSLYIRIPISPIQESIRISNRVLLLIGGISILVAGIIASFVSKKFTKPITELNNIATNMSKLDFSKKYEEKDTDDEINNLGKSINTMSDKLEKTIKQLRETNVELEKDIEEKSKIDEMRKQFISDVSHELKTPIALIQGYAEGLVENVNTDGESRKFYAEVILDETNKMDTLVKQLLELMKLEYGERDFNDTRFDITELIIIIMRQIIISLLIIMKRVY